MSTISPAYAIAAIYISACFLHLSFFHTEGPVRTLNGLLLLFLPVYAQSLRWPERHPYKAVAGYLVWVQLSLTRLASSHVQTPIIVGLYLYVRYALNKLSVTVLGETHRKSSADGKEVVSSTEVSAPESAEQGVDESTPQLMSVRELDSTEPVVYVALPTGNIARWPFQIVAGLIVFGGFLALIDVYNLAYHNSHQRWLDESELSGMSHFYRSAVTQVYYAIVFAGIQGFVTLPPGSFQCAFVALRGSLRPLYVAFYFIPLNLGWYILVQGMIYKTAYQYMQTVWALLFWTGPNFGLAAAFVHYLHLTCSAYEMFSAVGTDAIHENAQQHEQLAQKQDRTMGQDERLECLVASTPQLTPDHGAAVRRVSFGIEEAGIDISDLAGPSLMVDMPPDIDEHL